VDGPLALDVLGQSWGDVCYIDCDQTWRHRRKDGTGRSHTAPTFAEQHKMVADYHAFIPVRMAS
jgi:hypothetical protein